MIVARWMALAVACAALVAGCYTSGIYPSPSADQADPPASGAAPDVASPAIHGDYFPGLYESEDVIWEMVAATDESIGALTEIGPGRVVFAIGQDMVETTIYAIEGYDANTVRAARGRDPGLVILYVAPGTTLPLGLCKQLSAAGDVSPDACVTAGPTPDVVADFAPGLYRDGEVWQPSMSARVPPSDLRDVGMAGVAFAFGSLQEVQIYAVGTYPPDVVLGATEIDSPDGIPVVRLFLAPGVTTLPAGLCDRYACSAS